MFALLVTFSLIFAVSVSDAGTPHPWQQAHGTGQPAVTAIVVCAAYRIGLRALKNRVLGSIAVAVFRAILA